MRTVLIGVGLVLVVVIIALLLFDRKKVKVKAEPVVKSSRPAESETGNTFIDYDIYIMSKKEKFLYIIVAAAFLFAVAYIFYRSIILSLLVSLLAYYYLPFKTRELIAKRKGELNIQFKEALYSLSSSLYAGKSIEMAFRDVLKDLSIIYPNPDTYIIREFEYIVRKLEMNETVEDALANFAGRAHLEDIDSFADVFITSKRTGGNIIEIIKNTSMIIGDKLQIKQEIDTLLAQRKFEQKVLNVMPIAMVLLLSWSTGDYMAPVFTTIAGRLVMTIAIILLAIAFVVSKKIMDIEV